MTDRTRHLTVMLDNEYREDGVQQVIDAISMIRGVHKVVMNISNPGDWLVIEEAKRELGDKIWELLK